MNFSTETISLSEVCCLQNKENSNEELDLIAQKLYSNTLLQVFGFDPWKSLVQLKKRRKILRKLAFDNHHLKLLTKVFAGFFKEILETKEKPKNFRKLFILQKVFVELKKVLEKKPDFPHNLRRVSPI
jgi:hypothetical protein